MIAESGGASQYSSRQNPAPPHVLETWSGGPPDRDARIFLEPLSTVEISQHLLCERRPFSYLHVLRMCGVSGPGATRVHTRPAPNLPAELWEKLA